MSQPTEQRPPQVSLASGIVMFASLLVLVTAWERVASLGSLDTQRAIDTFLAEPPFSSLGLDAEGARQLLRIASLVAAASACATAILGWYVRKPDRSARLGLSIFAVPVFVAGLPSGGLAGVVRRCRGRDALDDAGARVVRHGPVDAARTRADPDPVSRTTPGAAAPARRPAGPMPPPPAARPFGTSQRRCLRHRSPRTRCRPSPGRSSAPARTPGPAPWSPPSC